VATNVCMAVSCNVCVPHDCRAEKHLSLQGWQLDEATKVIELDGAALSQVRYKRTLDPLFRSGPVPHMRHPRPLTQLCKGWRPGALHVEESPGEQ